MHAKSIAGALLAASLISPAAHAAPERYEIDPEHFSVGFLVDHIGYASVLGMFREASGSYTFDEASATLTDLRVVIETGSVFSNHRKRDQHLKSADFLNAAEYPEMVFTASSAQRTGDRTFRIDGELELLGRRQPVTLEAVWNKSAKSPIGGAYTMGVSARGRFERAPHGMTYGVDNGWVGNEVELILEFEAKRR